MSHRSPRSHARSRTISKYQRLWHSLTFGNYSAHHSLSKPIPSNLIITIISGDTLDLTLYCFNLLRKLNLIRQHTSVTPICPPPSCPPLNKRMSAPSAKSCLSFSAFPLRLPLPWCAIAQLSALGGSRGPAGTRCVFSARHVRAFDVAGDLRTYCAFSAWPRRGRTHRRLVLYKKVGVLCRLRTGPPSLLSRSCRASSPKQVTFNTMHLRPPWFGDTPLSCITLAAANFPSAPLRTGTPLNAPEGGLSSARSADLPLGIPSASTNHWSTSVFSQPFKRRRPVTGRNLRWRF